MIISSLLLFFYFLIPVTALGLRLFLDQGQFLILEYSVVTTYSEFIENANIFYCSDFICEYEISKKFELAVVVVQCLCYVIVEVFHFCISVADCWIQVWGSCWLSFLLFEQSVHFRILILFV